MTTTTAGPMTPEHPRWREFCDRLSGPEGCNFEGEPPKTTWRCNGGRDRTYAIAILTAMGLSADDIRWSLAFFDENGGHCDCEILFNVDPVED